MPAGPSMSEHGHAVQVAADEPAAAVVENGDAVQEPAAAADVGGVVEHVHAVLEPAPAAGDAAATQAEDPNLVRSVYLATIAHPQSVYAATGERLALPKDSPSVFMHHNCSDRTGQIAWRVCCRVCVLQKCRNFYEDVLISDAKSHRNVEISTRTPLSLMPSPTEM